MNIAIVGTGYVGLVSGTCFAEMGVNVTCVDVNAEKIKLLQSGQLPIYEPGLDEMVLRNHREGRLNFTTDLISCLDNVDIVFSAVGTPSDSDGSADLQYVLSVARLFGQNIKKYTILVTKSTVPVGTAQKVKAVICEELDSRGVEIPFDVASNPEFLKEGAAIKDFMSPDRVVVGVESEKAKEMMKRPEGTASFGWKEDDHYLTVSTEQFSYTYNKFTGLFEEMCYANQNLLDRPMELNIWRAPTDNDRNIKNTWMRAQYDRTVTRAYETTAKEENGCVEIETSYSISSPALQRILAGVIKWTIYSDGTTDVHVEAKKDPVFPVLPRFGLRLFLPESFAELTYCGLGPVESYVDKHQASYHGVFHSTPAEQQEDYIRPQENGSHYDCDYASLANDRVVLTAVGEKTFSFQASVYTQEELTEKAHNYELKPCGSTVFCIDYRQAGIGSASCGPMLLEKYQLKENEIKFAVRLKPELL